MYMTLCISFKHVLFENRTFTTHSKINHFETFLSKVLLVAYLSKYPMREAKSVSSLEVDGELSLLSCCPSAMMLHWVLLLLLIIIIIIKVIIIKIITIFSGL